MLKLDTGLVIEKLSEKHLEGLSDFDCGHQDLNEFTHKDIFEYQRQNIGVSYVLSDTSGRVLSFITLLMGAVRVPEEPSLSFDIPHVTEVPKQLPALKIGRLGTQKTEQRKGYARKLIEYTIYRAAKLRSIIGCYCLTLDSYPENILMYQKCGFEPSLQKLKARETMPMFMRLSNST